MSHDLRHPTDSTLAALRSYRRRQQAQNRRLADLRDRLALVVAERRTAWLDMLYGPEETEEPDDDE
ncbi:hypothetical protein [Nonomuraea wenchangensis]|uniref:Uncharacterized protein n=1 Tax=Nonomuraea wenchangensis TaxID=568860 RepID=A0A1I0EZN6_9ACTN|nr:hypothetical protein [Nonomuraea wenchangensis]SET50212.1 hypothetical protein SAMN05421811_103244 [Nonomuraea wenchangensis]